MKTFCLSVVFGLLCALPLAAWGDWIDAYPGKSPPSAPEAPSARGVNVELAIQNPQPSFLVRVSVDREDGIYEEGELMQVSVESERAGFLYLLYRQADGATKCLFPNQFDNDNRIQRGRKITLPTDHSRFVLRIAPPFGDEVLLALVTQEPMPAKQFGVRALDDDVVTDVRLDHLLPRGVDVEWRKDSATWAEHSVRIKTVPRGQRAAAALGHRRLGLFIGVSKYADARIRNLRVACQDAQVMARVMTQHGRLNSVGLLLNEQATRAAIERAFQDLILESRQNDEIFIYWSGHGGKCASTNESEPDGMDEFLVPYDGSPNDIRGTMVLDDTLARWIQALDGRKVCLILDACYSGGQAAGRGINGSNLGVKSQDASGGSILRDINDLSPEIRTALGLPQVDVAREHAARDQSPWEPLASAADFLGGRLAYLKNLGQQDADMLFSSASDEISAERRDGNLSVMTHFLVNKIQDSRTLTLAEAYEYVSVEVPKYMKEHFPSRQQTPQLVPEHGGRTVRLR